MSTQQTKRAVSTSPHTNYVSVALAAALTGLTEKAIRRKIEDGKWVEGREYHRAPDGGIFISMTGYQAWLKRREA